MMDAWMGGTPVLAARAEASPAPTDVASTFETLLANPFSGALQVASIWASLGSSIGITVGLALAFSFFRPFNNVVYAPKLKYADEEHAPPRLGKGIFDWFGPLMKLKEKDLVRLIGLDAALFLRFTRMLRDLFLVLSVLVLSILVPINYINSNASIKSANAASTSGGSSGSTDNLWVAELTPGNVFGTPNWAQVAVAWLSNIIICAFLWWNYKKVLQLRRDYFESPDYQGSLHARTLMIYDIPKQSQSDEGIARIIDSVVPNASFSRTTVARNVKDLPNLISEHEKTVKQLEKVLAVYLKDPKNLPPARPLCKPSKKDPSYARGQNVDAIEYLTQRIRNLELEIKEVRQSVDKRSCMSFGFASYDDIAEAHAIAYIARKQKPLGSIIKLAPKPADIIWDNMPLTAATRGRRRFINNIWIALLTLIWIAPNAMIAIFLVNLNNLGLVWPAFADSLHANNGFWSLVQGIASPAITSLIYLLLPVIFRRLSIQAGDLTKTSRERHVMAKLFSFFIFNNLVVFSIFSALWAYVSFIVTNTQSGKYNFGQAILRARFGYTMLNALCQNSIFFITWLLQRQLGAAIDLAQLWTLVWSYCMRRWTNPTPRELIELTRPLPFDYASYYTYFLFYAAVALCYAGIQPLVVPAAAIYFCIDVMMKKYLLLYIFVTKTESGGMFWRGVVNRVIFSTILANLVVFLIVWVQNWNPGEDQTPWGQYKAYSVVPLPFLMLLFKWYCVKTFDDKIHYYSTRVVGHPQPENVEVGIGAKENLRGDRLASKFGNPALYKPLITPMVHAKAQNILASIYQGRLTDGREAGSGDLASVSGYSDTYALDPMRAGKPGKSAAVPGFEVVPESKLDFAFYKNRDEFADEHGAGELFARPGTPSTLAGGSNGQQFQQYSDSGSRPGTPGSGTAFAPPNRRPTFPERMGSGSSDPPYGSPTAGSPGGAYQGIGQARPPFAPGGSPSEYAPQRTRSPRPLYANANDSATNLVGYAAPMASPPPIEHQRSGSGSRERSLDRDMSVERPVPGPAGGYDGNGYGAPPARRQGSLGLGGGVGGSPRGYGNVPQAEPETEYDPASYDYFRGGRNRAPRRRETGQGP